MTDTFNNKEWELHELVESLSAELDKFLDTVSLKSNARGVTFGLTSLNLELQVFTRFDPVSHKVLFRTAKPGEAGSSTIKLDIPSLIQDQIKTHNEGFERFNDHRPLRDLGIDEQDILRLKRLGIHSVGNFLRMAQSSDMRQAIQAKTGVKADHMIKWLRIPSIWRAEVEQNELVIYGENLDANELRTVFVNGEPVEVAHAANGRLKAKLPANLTKGSVTIADSTGLSETVNFSETKAPELPIERISGVGTKFHRLLKAANIATDTHLLAKTPEELAELLQVSHGTALNLYEQAARRIVKKD